MTETLGDLLQFGLIALGAMIFPGIPVLVLVIAGLYLVLGGRWLRGK